MRIYKIVLVLLVFTVSALPAYSETEFENSIPIELAKLFLGNPAIGEVFIYSDILDDFPVFTIPDNFEVVGSLDQGYSQRVVLITNLDEEAARAELLDSFDAAGWQLRQNISLNQLPQTGFVSSRPFPAGTTIGLCHDDDGNITIGVGFGDNGRLVNLTRRTPQPGSFTPTCREQNNQQQAGFFRGARSTLNEYMPRLELPDSPDLRGPVYPGGFSSRGNYEIESRTSISIDWSIAEVYEHFENQIIEQGWELDSNATGSFSANANWQKSPEDNIDLIGILSVLEIADTNFEVKFRLLRRNTQGNNSARGFFTNGGPLLLKVQ